MVLGGGALTSGVSVLGTVVANVAEVDVDIAGDATPPPRPRQIVLVLFELHDGDRHYSKYLPAIRHSLIDPLQRTPDNDTKLTVVVHTIPSATLADYASTAGADVVLADDDSEVHNANV